MRVSLFPNAPPPIPSCRASGAAHGRGTRLSSMSGSITSPPQTPCPMRSAACRARGSGLEAFAYSAAASHVCPNGQALTLLELPVGSHFEFSSLAPPPQQTLRMGTEDRSEDGGKRARSAQERQARVWESASKGERRQGQKEVSERDQQGPRRPCPLPPSRLVTTRLAHTGRLALVPCAARRSSPCPCRRRQQQQRRPQSGPSLARQGSARPRHGRPSPTSTAGAWPGAWTTCPATPAPATTAATTAATTHLPKRGAVYNTCSRNQNEIELIKRAAQCSQGGDGRCVSSGPAVGTPGFAPLPG